MKPAICGLLLAALSLSSPAMAAPCTLAGLTWMRGVWREDGAQTKGEERWTIASAKGEVGARLIGSAWFLQRASGGGLIEAMTILPEGNTVALRIRHFDASLGHAEEGADTPMLFVASRCEPNMVTLEGRGAQKGERMTYRRDGDRLTFRGDFIHDGKPVRDEEIFTRAGD
jgi:hypothetical protein